MRFRGESAAKLRVAALAAALSSSVVVSVGAARAAAASTADGRAYELVSPADKNGGDIAADRSSIVSSAVGDAVAYMSRASFGDTTGASYFGQTVYIARRGQAGWANSAISPMPAYDGSAALVGATTILGLSDDLLRTVVWGYNLPGVAGALPQTPNIYSEDTTARTLQLVTRPAGPVNAFSFIVDFAFPDWGGVSRNSRHLAFRAFTPLLPDAPLGVPSVYQWDDGTLRLASILPDGTPASAGALPALSRYRETVSPDGSRVLFTSPPNDPSGQLYMRVDHNRTVQVSDPETDPKPTPQDVVLQQMTGDSRHVIFSTSSRLRDDDPNDGSDLYLYTDSADPASDDANLTLVSDTGDLAGAAVVGSSEDARRIYYLKGQQLLLWEDGTTTPVADDVIPVSSPTDDQSLPATASGPGGARVSPDGRYLAFLLGASPTRTGLPVAEVGGHVEMYLYDAVNDALQCVSCPSSGDATADASIMPTVTHISPAARTLGLRPGFLAADGRTFFSTAEPLVPQDVNGITDAYEFDPATGEVVLLSTGKGSQPASFAAASASGDDAFIVTRQQLVKADRDSLVDVYDVRVGGGFPEQEPAAACDGEGCQGAVGPAPEDIAPGSLHVDSGPAAPPKHVRIRRHAVDGARASLRIALPAAGTVAWNGHGLRRGSHRFSAAGTPTIDVALTPRARRALRAGRVVRVKLHLTFTPLVGPPSGVTTSLTFKRPSSKKGR